MHFSALSVLVPFASHWRPSAVAWGVVGMYLLLAVELTSLARRRLPKRAWRAVHFASFPLFFMATIHAFTAGTDAASWAFVSVATTAVLAVVGLTGKRIVEATREPEPDASPARAGWPPPGSRSACRRGSEEPTVRALLRKLMRYATVSMISTGVSMCVLGGLVATATLAAGWANVAAFGSLWVVQFVVLDRLLFHSRHVSATESLA